MSDRLASRIEGLGGGVYLRRPVEGLVVDDGRCVGVQLAPRRGVRPVVRAKAVVCAGDTATALLHLVPSDAPRSNPKETDWVAKAPSFKDAAGLFSAYVGIDEAPEKLKARGFNACNYWCFDNTDFDMTYQRVRGGDMSGSFGAYITSASIKDPSHHHAPQGISNVEIMTLVSMSPSHWGLDSQPSVGSLSYRRNDKYQEVKKGLERAMLTHLDKQFPGLADKVVFMESSTPFSHRRFTHGGTAYVTSIEGGGEREA